MIKGWTIDGNDGLLSCLRNIVSFLQHTFPFSLLNRDVATAEWCQYTWVPWMDTRNAWRSFWRRSRRSTSRTDVEERLFIAPLALGTLPVLTCCSLRVISILSTKNLLDMRLKCGLAADRIVQVIKFKLQLRKWILILTQVRTATRPIRIIELVFIMPVRIYNKNVSWLSSRRVLKWTRRVCNVTTYHCLSSDCQCL